MNNVENINVRRIVDALHSVQCAHEVYEALTYVPLENLEDMLHMIEHILKEAEWPLPQKNA